MNPREVLQKITESPQYAEWKRAQPKAYLAHLFTDDQNNDQVGYFDPVTNTISTFEVGDEITVTTGAKYLKSTQPIEEFVPTESLIDSDFALQQAKEQLEATYSSEAILKYFVILQVIGQTRTYNITFFTRSFKTINIRVDALSGTVTEHSMAALVDFAK